MGAKTSPSLLGSVVLDFCVPCGLLNFLRNVIRTARALWSGYGRRVGRGNAAGARALAGEIARVGIRIVTGWLVLGVSVRGGGVSVCLPVVLAQHRMARHVLGRDSSGAVDVVDSNTSARKPRLAGASASHATGATGRPIGERAHCIHSRNIQTPTFVDDHSNNRGDWLVHVYLL